MRTSFSQVQLLWDITLSNLREKRLFLFADADLPMAEAIQQQINLHDYMSFAELQQALSLIESVKTGKDGQSIRDLLIDKKHRCLSDINLIPRDIDKTFQVTNDQLIACLIRTHDALLISLEKGLLRSQKRLSTQDIKYSRDELQQSQAFYSLQVTTELPRPSDESTILPDIKRGGVCLQSEHPVLKKAGSSSLDEQIKQTIESMTGENLSDPDSTASKLFHFGGQFLEGVLTAEFADQVFMPDKSEYRLEPAFVDGVIIWYKQDGKVLADVELTVYSVNAINIVDSAKPPEMLMLGSDNTTLVVAEDEQIAMLSDRFKDAKDPEKPTSIAPIGSITATIGITALKTHRKRAMQVSDCEVQLNSEDLTHNLLIVRKEASQSWLNDMVSSFKK